MGWVGLDSVRRDLGVGVGLQLTHTKKATVLVSRARSSVLTTVYRDHHEYET